MKQLRAGRFWAYEAGELINQGCGRGSSPFSVEVEAEARKFYRFRFHISYLT